jgi:hypothetical protein
VFTNLPRRIQPVIRTIKTNEAEMLTAQAIQLKLFSSTSAAQLSSQLTPADSRYYWYQLLYIFIYIYIYTLLSHCAAKSSWSYLRRSINFCHTPLALNSAILLPPCNPYTWDSSQPALFHPPGTCCGGGGVCLSTVRGRAAIQYVRHFNWPHQFTLPQ